MNSIPSIPFRKQPEVSSKERRHEDFVPWRSIVQRMLEWETTVRFTSNQALEAFKQINNDHFKSYASI